MSAALRIILATTRAQDAQAIIDAAHAAGLIENARIDAEDGKCWSSNNEDFNCRELGDLLDENEELKVGDTVYVADVVHPSSSQFCDADDVIDTMRDRASDIGGEYAEDYPDIADEAKAELNAFLAAWIDKHASPSFYTVINAKPYILSADDFAEVVA